MINDRNIIIGINWEQNSTAAIMINNKLVGCVSEERFSNIKNDERYPKRAIDWLIKNFDVKKSEIKSINYISHSWSPTYSLIRHYSKFNTEDYIKELSDIGIHNFTFHWETVTHHHSIITLIKEKYKSVGISLNPGTDVSVIPNHILEMIDVILVMSVNPGFGGPTFIEATYDKVQYFNEKRKELNLDLKIQVDGGVNSQNAQKLRSYGADILVAGSFIFNSNNYSESINKLR